jgi:hypothetical protein
VKENRAIANPPAPDALLLLGRLDGRLQHSPAADLWLARARLHGAVTLAHLAGVPISLGDLQDWICGRSPPPRHSEGLNDPLSVAALFHLALDATDAVPVRQDPVSIATRNVLRTLLDDRSQAETWGGADLVRWGPAWRTLTAETALPYPAATLTAVADRMFVLWSAGDTAAALPGTAPLVTTADGRQLQLPPAAPDSAWAVAAQLPAALHAAGLTLRPLPSFTTLPRFRPATADALAATLVGGIARTAARGLAELDRLERAVTQLPAQLGVTRRSKAPLLARLDLIYPGLTLPAVARLLGISPQGAVKVRQRLHRAF